MVVVIFINVLPAAGQDAQNNLLHLSASEVNEYGLINFGTHSNWKYHPGDDLRWADPHYDDSDWYDIPPGELAIAQMPDSLWEGYGWWRITFEADSSFYAENWNLYYFGWGGAEVYLDGERVQSYGKFAVNPDDERNYTPLNRILKPVRIEKGNPHHLAVRYSNHQAKNIYPYFQNRARDLGFGLGFASHSFNEYRVQISSYQSFTLFASSAVLFVLFLLHLTLHYRFPEDRSNLLIAIVVGLLLVSVISVYTPFMTDVSMYQDALSSFIWSSSAAIAILSMPYVITSIFRTDRLNKVVYLLFVGFPFLLFSEFMFGIDMATTHYLALIFYAFSFILIGYICWYANRQGVKGVKFVAFGTLGSIGLVIVYIFYFNGLITMPPALFFIKIAFLYSLFPLGMTLYVADRYGYLFTSMEKEVAERTEELQASLKREKTEASASRIRAEIASLRSVEDLQQITPLIWRELKTLEVPFSRCGVFIVDEENREVHMHLSNPDGKALASTVLSFDEMEFIGNALEKWKKNEILSVEWDADRFMQWTQKLSGRGLISSTERYLDAEAPPDLLRLHFVPFNQGMLYVGSTDQLSEVHLKSIKQLADAFSVAFARYQDFQRLEDKNNELTAVLENLSAAQDQLVQQEKLASLGQLTAGIAHEIKNPLNFVNNFSEVSLELVDEAEQEVQNVIEGKLNGELSTILTDIKANLTKIHQHGSRADGIVKSMLQHSRGGSGKPEPTNLNDLVKEYTNLAYHGMRAGKYPISVDIELDLDENIGEVPLIREDFSRVILNLCNNAFDAMRSGQTNEFKPKLTVRTRQEQNQVTIQIEDNGMGIPEAIKDKILQPFVTTKKGTEGTGLGLSISNDIVHSHGGRIQIESEKGQFTRFSIVLPVQN